MAERIFFITYEYEISYFDTRLQEHQSIVAPPVITFIYELEPDEPDDNNP